MLLILLGPSGSGKTTQAEILKRSYNFKKIVTYTTRSIREGEKNHESYNFINKGQFEDKIKKNFFFEYTIYANNYYGTSKESIVNAAKSSDNFVLTVDGNGAKVLKEKIPCTTIYLEIPKEIIFKRLMARGEKREIVEKRIKISENYRDLSDYVIDGTNSVQNITEEILKIYKKIRA